MSRGGVAEALTVDHKPSRNDEKDRIESMVRTNLDPFLLECDCDDWYQSIYSLNEWSLSDLILMNVDFRVDMLIVAMAFGEFKVHLPYQEE